MRNSFVLGLLILLTGCATPLYVPVPAGFSGPTAVVKDSAKKNSSVRANICVVNAIDDKNIENALGVTSRASFGHGATPVIVNYERNVPAQAMKLTLLATHYMPADGLAMISQLRGNYLSVRGDVQITPLPGKTYVVKGILKKGASSVWLEDAGTHEVVTDKIIEGQGILPPEPKSVPAKEQSHDAPDELSDDETCGVD